MRLEEQVVSLELAKRLKELGVKQESIFAWCKNELGHITLVYLPQWIPQIKKHGEWWAAFTVAELGEMLPPLCEIKRTRENNWRLEYISTLTVKDGRPHFDRHSVRADTEADARAKMLIYLIEQKLIPTQEAKP